MWPPLVLVVLLLGQCSVQISEDCELFHMNRICIVDEINFLAELENIGDEVSCQEECLFTKGCTHFTWNTVAPGPDYASPKCFLLTDCSNTTECDGACESSLAGPAYPSYKDACCGDFYGSACVQDGSNMIHVEFNVPDEYQCQKMCQDPIMECSFFTFDSDVCILFNNCTEVEPCLSCVTGPIYPDLDICEEPSIGVLISGIGYDGYLSSVEIADSGAICGNVLPDLPVARKGSNSALLSGRILTCGGEDREDNFFNECFSYDPADNVWSEVASITEPRAYFSMEKVHGKMVVTGGEGKDGYMSSVEAYRDGVWSIEPELELSSPRYRHCSVALDQDTLVVIGGKTNGFLNNILSLMEMKDVAGSGSWIGLPSMSQSREGHGCEVTHYQGRRGIMVAGGYTGNPQKGAITSHVEFYGVETGQWEVLPGLGQFREYHTLGVVNGNPSVFGGAKPEYLRSTEVFIRDEWVMGEDLPTTRWAHSMVTVPKSFPRCPTRKNKNGTFA